MVPIVFQPHSTNQVASMRMLLCRLDSLPRFRVAVYGHRSTLLIHDVIDGGANLTRLPQVPCAAVMRPTLPTAGAFSIQGSRRIRLELFHRFLRRNVCFDNNVHVIRAHVDGVQKPAPNLCVVTNRLENKQSFFGAKLVSAPSAQPALGPFPINVRVNHRCPPNIVEAVYRTARIAVKPSAIAGECENVRRRAGTGPLGR